MKKRFQMQGTVEEKDTVRASNSNQPTILTSAIQLSSKYKCSKYIVPLLSELCLKVGRFSLLGILVEAFAGY